MNNQIPAHIKDELSGLTQAQILKFHELLQWASSSGLSGVSLDVITYDKIMAMVRRMGPESIISTEPDKTVNHDWPANFKPRIDK